MPQAASSIGDPILRVLLMGAAKVGKTVATIPSLVKAVGTGYVIACSGDKGSVAPAARRTSKFTYDLVHDETEMEAAIKEARRGVKEGRYKWIFVDDFSLYASVLEGLLRDWSSKRSKSGEANGREVYPELKTRIMNVPRRLFDLDVHIVFATHYIEQNREMDGQRAKSGTGIVPMIPGSAREELPALFQDVVFMEKDKDKRVFRVNVNGEGVWGPGSRSLDGVETIDADFGEFLKKAREIGQSKMR
jgi:hypothetical protein